MKKNSLYSHSRLRQYFGRCSLFIASVSMLHDTGIEATTSFSCISLEPCGKYDLIGSCALGIFTYFLILDCNVKMEIRSLNWLWMSIVWILILVDSLSTTRKLKAVASAPFSWNKNCLHRFSLRNTSSTYFWVVRQFWVTITSTTHNTSSVYLLQSGFCQFPTSGLFVISSIITVNYSCLFSHAHGKASALYVWDHLMIWKHVSVSCGQ